jgi:hypothetical protein
MRTAEPFLWCAAPSRPIANEVQVRLHAERLRVYHWARGCGIELRPEPSTKFVTLATSVRQKAALGLPELLSQDIHFLKEIQSPAYGTPFFTSLLRPP